LDSIVLAQYEQSIAHYINLLLNFQVVCFEIACFCEIFNGLYA